MTALAASTAAVAASTAAPAAALSTPSMSTIVVDPVGARTRFLWRHVRSAARKALLLTR